MSHTLKLTDNQLLVLLAALHQNAVMLPLTVMATQAMCQRYRAAQPRGWFERLPAYTPTIQDDQSLPEQIAKILRDELMR